MRTRLNVLLPIFLIAIMLGSVALPQFSNIEQGTQELTDEPVFFETSGRSSSTMLAAGSGANNEDAEHIAALPNGGWVIGSEFNSTLTYGQQTLQPTSPYPGLVLPQVSFSSVFSMTKERGQNSSELTTIKEAGQSLT